jgi:hypothetical protein
MRSLARFLALRIGIVATCLAFCGLWIVTTGATAQEATPAAGEVVPPEECTTPARPATFLADLIATPAALVPMTTVTALPEGTEPDEQIRQEITAVVRQLIACSNTGDLLRALTLYGDDYLRRALNSTGELTAEAALEIVAPFATPLAIPAEQYIRLVEIRDMRVLADGRVAAVVVTVPFGGGLDTDLLFFARTDDGWFIDDAVADVALD